MNKLHTKAVAAVSVVTATLFALAGAAGASTPTEANDVIVPEIASARADLLVIAGAAIAAGAIFVAIRKGWRMFKSMIGG